MKRVSLIVQILPCLIIPIISLGAFSRIEKLQKGILLWVLLLIMIYSYVHVATPPALFDVDVIPNSINISNFFTGLYIVMSVAYILPIYFVLHWSKEWNRKIDQKSVTVL